MAVLHEGEIRTKLTVPTKMDEEIGKVIANNNSSSFDKYLQADSGWDMFYHLSSLRLSLFNWYEFQKETELLEIGGAFGALTGLFCERCKHVTVIEQSFYRAECICKRHKRCNNLDVWNVTIDEIQWKNKFDYIIVTNLLGLSGSARSNPEQLLKKLKSMLKPRGTLLLAAENRFGLRYFCGIPDFYTNRPFDGINKYPLGGDIKALNRNEWMKLLTAAGMEKYKFYYPLPDYIFPQVIYSDDYLPKHSIRDRVVPYYVNQNTMIALEDNMYDDVIQNQMFPVMANSFLIEYTEADACCPIIYATISADREKERSFVTAIYSDDIVKKIPIYIDGVRSLERIQKNLEELEERGIDVISTEMCNGVMKMPKIQSGTLISYMEEIIEKDRDMFVQYFDELYQKILLSSDVVSDKNNVLVSVESEKDDLGVILKKAYLEMIPYNCFYDNGKILFFDQEFDQANCPAKYVLFRALRYTYLYIPKAEGIIPIQFFKDKYKLDKVWKLFEAEENGFIERNHNPQLFRQLCHWTEVDNTKIYNRMQQNTKLQRDLIKGAGSCMPFNNQLKRIQQIEKKLLREFDFVCREYKLHYCAIYGTLLGTVRHNGFIPWDDDIDVAMPREDYDRLIRNADIWFQHPLFLQTPENDPECFYGGYIKLRDSTTSGLERINYNHNCNQGIWIDILPLDFCFEDLNKRKRQLKEIQIYQRLLFAKVYPENKELLGNITTQKKQFYKRLSKKLSHRWLCRKLDRAMKRCEDEQTEYLSVLAHYSDRLDCKLLFKKDFEYSVTMKFEDMNIPVPIGYQRCLTIRTGEDYMCFPKEKLRKPHHAMIFSDQIPYKKYIKMLKGFNCKGE